MARTFVSQNNQIFTSSNYDDSLATGVTLQTSATDLQSDLNALRTQVRQILWANVSGSWYDAVTAPSGSNSARGLNTLNTDLSDLEQKRFLFRRQNLNIVQVATGSNYVSLSVALGTAPANFMVVSHPLLNISNATGSLVSLLSGTEGAIGTHSIAQTSGSSNITPKNLVIIRDAYTGFHLTGASGKDVYGLLQVESSGTTGVAFNDTTQRSQISFVIEQVTNSTSSLVAASSGLVGGRVVQYSYVKRTALDDIPEDAYLSNTLFIDFMESSGGGGSGGTVTLNEAIDNQTGTVTQDQAIAIRMAAGTSWTYLSGTAELWKLASSDSLDTYTVSVDQISFSSSLATSFQKGITVATGSTTINIGVVNGTIHTNSGSNLILSGGAQLRFGDFFGTGSTYTGGTIPFATSTLEWNNFTTDYGNQTSILGALHVLSQSVSSSFRRTRYTAGVTVNTVANTNMLYPTNLDAPLANYTGKNFINDLEIYYNGILLLPGSSVSNSNDVYPGTSPTTGDIKFPYSVSSGTQITMIRY